MGEDLTLVDKWILKSKCKKPPQFYDLGSIHLVGQELDPSLTLKDPDYDISYNQKRDKC